MPKSAKSEEWGPQALIEWMLKSKNVSKVNIRLLLESKDQINLAWDRDDRGTKRFPMNTAHLLYERGALLKGWRPRKNRKKGMRIRLKEPKCLGDILPDRDVEQIHEYLHEEPFREALIDLYSQEGHSRALKRITETVGAALFAVQHGYETLPKPRGNWLHRQILDVLTAAAPGKFSDRDMAKLFNYFCPCGAEHNREAMKKFRWRLARAHG
jgi:hypothetical protein